MAAYPAVNFNLAYSPGYGFSNTVASDLVIQTTAATQSVHIGSATTSNAALRITSNVVAVTDTLNVGGNMSVGGSVITTNALQMNGFFLKLNSNVVGNTSITSMYTNVINNTGGMTLLIPSSNAAFKFQASNTGCNLLTLTGGGWLGMGTSNPTAMLDIWGQCILRGSTVVTGTATFSNPVMLAGCNVTIAKTLVASNIHTSNLSIEGTLVASNIAVSNITVYKVDIHQSNLVVTNGGSFGGGYSNVGPPVGGLIVQGNVGIGTSNPLAALDVAGSVNLGKSGSSLSILGCANPLFIGGALSDEVTALTGTSNSVKVFAPYAMNITNLKLPKFTVNTAPTAAVTFDITLNGSSIYNALPTIAVGSNISSGGVLLANPTAVAENDALVAFVSAAGSGASGAKVYIYTT